MLCALDIVINWSIEARWILIIEHGLRQTVARYLISVAVFNCPRVCFALTVG